MPTLRVDLLRLRKRYGTIKSCVLISWNSLIFFKYIYSLQGPAPPADDPNSSNTELINLYIYLNYLDTEINC